jgi:hypothetical protein
MRDYAMMPRQARFALKAANDNFVRPRRGEPSPVIRFPRPEPFRIGARSLLIAGFAGLVLVALSGAFLMGLAAVGLVALAVVGLEAGRRYLKRRRRLAALDRRVAGYP